ncbi:MAG: hypothetical protein RLZZ455_1086 [Candidatus Parcubacteria bacterium]
MTKLTDSASISLIYKKIHATIHAMELTFFGTGSSTPTPTKPLRSYSGFSVEVADAFLLFDIGPGTVSKMLEDGIDIQKKPTHLFISHFHLDHCLDYITLLKARALYAKYHGQPKSILNVYGPTGLQKFSKNLFEGIEQWRYMSDELKVFDHMKLSEITNGVVAQTDKWKVSSAPITHYNGVSYRLDYEGKSLVYSGDMGYDEAIAKLGENADLAILECSYPSREENKGLHLYPEDIGKLAKKGNFTHVLLTHLYPACEGREDEIIKKISSSASCEVSIASDFTKRQL